MLILLPPSEGKTPATTGSPVDHDELWLPRLGPARRRVQAKLVSLSRRTSPRAVAETLGILGLSDRQRDELARNAELATAPAAPAAQVYTGVLYEALDHASLAAGPREWLDRNAIVFSGLWGVVRLGDRIPAYRCSVGATLPGAVGGLTAYWKKALKPALDPAAADGPVLDLRSGAYGAMWASSSARTATVRVLHDGKVVSHFNKATKGRVVRSLAESGGTFGSIDEVVAALRDLKYTVEELPVAAGRPRQLDIVVSSL